MHGGGQQESQRVMKVSEIQLALIVLNCKVILLGRADVLGFLSLLFCA